MYICPICGKIIASKAANYRRHLNLHNSDKKKYSAPCAMNFSALSSTSDNIVSENIKKAVIIETIKKQIHQELAIQELQRLSQQVHSF